MSCSRRPSAGFTLLEMLLAVIIIAVVGITVSTAVGGVGSQTFVLERRTVANWIAQNTINELRIQQRLPAGEPLPTRRQTRRVFMAERDWEVVLEIKPTDTEVIARVEVDVYELVDDDRRGPYEHLVAFVGERPNTATRQGGRGNGF